MKQKESVIKPNSRYEDEKTQVERTYVQVKANALKLASAARPRDRVKINDCDAVAITGRFIETNESHLVDPLEVVDLMNDLQDEVEGFETEIDATLSEANAITVIEV